MLTRRARRNAEAALVQKEALSRAVLDSLTAQIAVLDQARDDCRHQCGLGCVPGGSNPTGGAQRPIRPPAPITWTF